MSGQSKKNMLDLVSLKLYEFDFNVIIIIMIRFINILLSFSSELKMHNFAKW